MLRIGLTGGIGSGKSTVAARLAELGACVVDSDAIAREVVAPGSPGLAAVVERFGPGMLADDGSLDRSALASTVFGDEGLRSELEAILHPLIAERTAAAAASAKPGSVVVFDTPLLVEKHMGPGFHLVVVVDTPVETRVQRLVSERGMSEADVRARLAHQASDDQRRAAADVLLPNDGSVEQLADATAALWRDRLVPFAEHLQAGTVWRRPDTLDIAPYDEEWPRAADRVVERIGAALGDRAPEIEHVGSTAVPGMPGKDVIDVQVGVRSLGEADDPAFVAALTEAGFPRVEDYRMDHPTDDLADPSLWVKRFHGSSDPGQVVHVHVRELGSAGWQYALLFRDWLRSDPAAAQEYVEVKRVVAADAPSTAAYAEAKAPWFNTIWPRMQSFAQRTGWSS